MEQIERAGVSGQWVQYNQFTFKNVTSDLKKVEDPEMQKYFEDNCVIFNPTPEERLEHWQPYFSGAALSSSPLMADVKAEMDAQAKDAIGQFFDGNLSEEGLSQTFQNLYQKLTDACKERGYPLPLWDTYMPPAALKGLYSEFRYQILDVAVQRNNQEGRQYVTGELTADRNWKYYNSDYYFKSEEAISAVTDKFLSMTQENQWEDILSVPDYKEMGRNLYYNFNSALSNNFDLSDQYILNTDQIPPKDFRWFYQSGGDGKGNARMTGLTIEHPDGRTEFIDYTTPGFDPTDPSKATTWAAYKDEDGVWRHTSKDFIYNFTEADLKNVSSLLKFAGKSGAAEDAVNRFLKNLQVYPAGHFSRFSKYGRLNMDLRA